MAGSRPAPGIEPLEPGLWELVVDAGRDPVTGRRRRVTRRFRGNLREAKKARAALVVEVSRGRHDGTKATVDDLCREWLRELERKGRSPNTIRNYRRHYEHDVKPTLGRVEVRKVSTKMLTDLYGAHQDRGVAAGTVYQIHATISAMMTQACRWGWRDSNPAQWAETPPRPSIVPVVPTPEQVLALVEAAQRSRRPEYGRAMLLAATTGIRRGELCALRRQRDVNWAHGVLTVAHNMIDINGRPVFEAPTKNRRQRSLALGPRALAILSTQVEMMSKRAAECDAELVEDCYLFSDAVDGSQPWRPGAITLYFSRLRVRAGQPDLQFKQLRKFMETYGQDLGFSLAQVALRAGHDPAVASRHYTGRVSASDKALAQAIEDLLSASADRSGTS